MRKLVTMLAALAATTAWARGGPAAAGESAFAAALESVRLEAAKARSAAILASNERDALLELLKDPDAGVRRAALRSLKGYVGQTSEVRERVLRVFLDRSEDAGVRREAVKTLSVAANDDDVRDRLLASARTTAEGDDLRALAYKALYWAVSQRSDTRETLVDAARREPEGAVRRGAVWALFAASGDPRVSEALVAVVRRESDEALRVEAMKSLYGGVGRPEVRREVIRVAKDSGEPTGLRYGAILSLSAVVSSETRDALLDLSRRERDPELRRAAALAMDPSNEAIARYFHLVRRGQNGRLLDPLEDE